MKVLQVFIAIFLLVALDYRSFGKKFKDIPLDKCPELCYQDEFGKSIAQWQCKGRKDACKVQSCHSTGFACSTTGKTKPESKNKKLPILVTSGDGSKSCEIKVAGDSLFPSSIPESMRDEHVHTVALGQENGQFLSFATSHKFYEHHHSLSYGDIVLVQFHDMHEKFDKYSQFLISSLGSQKISASSPSKKFCMVGRVGAAADSATEVASHAGQEPAILSTQYELEQFKLSSLKIDISLKSDGTEHGFGAILINGMSVLAMRGPNLMRKLTHDHPGFMVAALTADSGTLTNLHIINDALRRGLPDYLSTLTYGQIVIIVKIKPFDISFIDRWVIEGLGSSKIWAVGEKDSFCMVGRVRAEANTAIEAHNRSPLPSFLRVPEFKLEKVRAPPDNQIHVRIFSAGPDDGNDFDIRVDGLSARQALVIPRSLSYSSMFVVTFNKKTKTFVNYFQVRFNPHHRDEAFQNLIWFLNDYTKDSYVLIATKGGLESRFTAEVKERLKQFGSTKVDEYDLYDSWAMIGQRNGPANEVLTRRFTGPAKLDVRGLPLQ